MAQFQANVELSKGHFKEVVMHVGGILCSIIYIGVMLSLIAQATFRTVKFFGLLYPDKSIHTKCPIFYLGDSSAILPL